MTTSCHGRQRDDSLAPHLDEPTEGITPMEAAVIAQKSPMTVSVEAGKKYAWCACGKSTSQPFCDGSHKGGEFKPLIFVAERSEVLWLCACKQTRTQPHCDGTHNSL
jgi:CDGSH iron-sulfur domain-containing protein 3